jgi:hypothetical protein
VCGVQVRLSREEMKRLKKELLRAKEEVQRALAVEAECVSSPPRNRRGRERRRLAAQEHSTLVQLCWHRRRHEIVIWCTNLVNHVWLCWFVATTMMKACPSLDGRTDPVRGCRQCVRPL